MQGTSFIEEWVGKKGILAYNYIHYILNYIHNYIHT